MPRTKCLKSDVGVILSGTGRLTPWPVVLAVFSLVIFCGIPRGCWRAHQPPQAVTEADIPTDISPELRTLIRQTFSTDPRTRADALKKLGDMGPAAAPAALFVIRLAWDDASLDGDRKDKIEGEGNWVGGVALEAIAKIGKPALDLLLVQLDDPVAGTREMAVLALDRSTDPGIVLPLIRRFKDPDERVRGFAVMHFETHRDARVVQPLLEVLDDEGESIPHYACCALGHQQDRRAVPRLLAILRDPDDYDRASAAFALGEIGDPAGLEAVVGVLQDPGESPRLRMSAAWSLTNASDCSPAAVEALTQVLRDCSEIAALRGVAVQSLAEIPGAKVLPWLAEIARKESEDDQVRFWAAMSVVNRLDGAIDDPLILPPLKKMFVDLPIRVSISEMVDRRTLRDRTLAKVAKQGKTAAVRAEAGRLLDEIRQHR